MLRRSLKISMSVVVIVSYLTLMVGTGYAAGPSVKIIVNPNKTDVVAGSDAVAITAKASGTGLQYKWELQGPGELEGSGSAVFYNIPDTITGDSAQAIVTVTVTDEAGQETTETVTFNILPGKKTTPAAPPAVPKAKKGMSTGTKIAIGVGAAALIGGAVALAAGGGDDDDDEPFTGTFARSYTYTASGVLVNATDTLRLTQSGGSITGTRDMFRSYAGCCDLTLSVSASGTATGNTASIDYASGQQQCSGAGGCGWIFTFTGATFSYTLLGNGNLQSGTAEFVKQSLICGDQVQESTVIIEEGIFVRQ